jgi:hypothetical protein
VTDRDGSWGGAGGSARTYSPTSVLVIGWGWAGGWSRACCARLYRLAGVLIKLAQVLIKEGGRGRGRDAFCDRILEWILEY